MTANARITQPTKGDAQHTSNKVIFVINQYASDLKTGLGGRSYSLAVSWQNRLSTCSLSVLKITI